MFCVVVVVNVMWDICYDLKLKELVFLDSIDSPVGNIYTILQTKSLATVMLTCYKYGYNMAIIPLTKSCYKYGYNMAIIPLTKS